MQSTSANLRKRSLIGLNAANFFQAEMVGVILPILNAWLKKANWRYDAIGFATAAAGQGTLLFQTPAGWLTDKLISRRFLFAVMALITGACFSLIPLVPRTQPWVDSLLFVSGATQSFFVPLLGALALAAGGTQAPEPRDGFQPELEPCRQYRGGCNCDRSGLGAWLDIDLLFGGRLLFTGGRFRPVHPGQRSGRAKRGRRHSGERPAKDILDVLAERPNHSIPDALDPCVPSGECADSADGRFVRKKAGRL